MKDLSHLLQDLNPTTTIARKKNLSPIMRLARTNHLFSQPTKTLIRKKNIFPQIIPTQRKDTMKEDVPHTGTKTTTTDNLLSQDLPPLINTAKGHHLIQETKTTTEDKISITMDNTTTTTQETTSLNTSQSTGMIQDQIQDNR